jgi:hypothetical protein
VELTNWLRSSRWFSFGVFYLKCFAAFFCAVTYRGVATRRFWVLQQGKRSSAWTQTTRSLSSRKLKLIHGTR